MGVIVGPFKEPPIRAGLTERKLDIIHTLQSQLHIKKKKVGNQRKETSTLTVYKWMG